MAARRLRRFAVAAIACGAIGSAFATGAQAMQISTLIPQNAPGAGVTVGQTVTGAIQIYNDTASPLNITSVRFNPSCKGSFSGCDNGGTSAFDSGVLSLGTTVSSAEGCAASSWTLGAADGFGNQTFTPSPAPALTAGNGVGGTDTCVISFGVSALKLPTVDTVPGPTGVQTKQQVRVSHTGAGFQDFGSSDLTVHPSPPTLTDTDPDSPANFNFPAIKGSAIAGTDVQLYSDSSCSTTLPGTIPAANFATPGFNVIVADNTATTFSARAIVAGDSSACSSTLPANGSITYREATPPPAPTLTATNPPSGANDNNPEIIGSALGDSTVQLYSDSSCSTAIPGATGPATTFNSTGITVTVGDNTTTTFYARASNSDSGATATSPCSSTLSANGSITYQEVTPPPQVPPTVTPLVTTPGPTGERAAALKKCKKKKTKKKRKKCRKRARELPL